MQNSRGNIQKKTCMPAMWKQQTNTKHLRTLGTVGGLTAMGWQRKEQVTGLTDNRKSSQTDMHQEADALRFRIALCRTSHNT